MTIRAITAVLTIAGLPFVVACTPDEKKAGEGFFKALGVNDLAASPAPAVAYVTEVVEEVPEPSKMVWDCWDEWHRGGTMLVQVCGWINP